MRRDPFRLWVSTNLHLLSFLGSYFLTTVAANLIFASPLAKGWLAASNSSDRFLAYTHTFTLGYWILLLCPFVLTPLVVAATRKTTGHWVGRAAQIVPEFSRIDFAIIAGVCFGFVIYKFWLADVSALFASGLDAGASVEARFTIRERIGYSTLVFLQALLPFLTLYALIRWIHSGQLFWMAFTILNTFLLSVLLIMIHMKWPVLLFYIGMVLAIFMYARRYTYLTTAIGAALILVVFLLMTAFVFRFAPLSGKDRHASALAERTASQSPDSPPSPPVDVFVETTTDAPAYAPLFMVFALNRMAISYPYYYQVFTEEGAACGGILAQARRNPPCRPSKVIYARIYVNDGFENRGTSPIGVHISGYALGGWPIAMFALVAGSVILGLFAALPQDGGPAAGTLTILGALAGYHLSQVPGEGVIFYEHGLIWPGLLIVGYVVWRSVVVRAGRRIARSPGANSPSSAAMDVRTMVRANCQQTSSDACGKGPAPQPRIVEVAEPRVHATDGE
jgi:hypothetical protein